LFFYSYPVGFTYNVLNYIYLYFEISFNGFNYNYFGFLYIEPTNFKVLFLSFIYLNSLDVIEITLSVYYIFLLDYEIVFDSGNFGVIIVYSEFIFVKGKASCSCLFVAKIDGLIDFKMLS